MLDRRKLPRKRATLAADRGYDTKAFVEELRQRGVTPHIDRNTSGRRSAIDARTHIIPAMPRACASVNASRSVLAG